MYNVYSQLDRLDTCIVGVTYNHLNHNPKIIEETNKDLDKLATFLQTKFDINVIRPGTTTTNLPAPLTPRDYIGVIDETLFVETYNTNWNDLKGDDWPTDAPTTNKEWDNLPEFVVNELHNIHNIKQLQDIHKYEYKNLIGIVESIESNSVIKDTKIDTAMITNIGKTLIVGTWPHIDYPKLVKKHFPDHTIHVVDSQGHLDGTICVVSENLIISRNDVEVDVPGFETLYVEKTPHKGDQETVFDINMLVIDQNNVVCLYENETIFKKLQEHNITPHIVDFRHHEYWDAGIHCLTADLKRV